MEIVQICLEFLRLLEHSKSQIYLGPSYIHPWPTPGTYRDLPWIYIDHVQVCPYCEHPIPTHQLLSQVSDMRLWVCPKSAITEKWNRVSVLTIIITLVIIRLWPGPVECVDNNYHRKHVDTPHPIHAGQCYSDNMGVVLSETASEILSTRRPVCDWFREIEHGPSPRYLQTPCCCCCVTEALMLRYNGQ